MSEIKNGGLDQYGDGPFEQQQFGTAGVEGVKRLLVGLGLLTVIALGVSLYLRYTQRYVILQLRHLTSNVHGIWHS